MEALNSNDVIEVQAAIYAVAEFSKVSQSFNKGAIDAIASKIQVSLSSSVYSLNNDILESISPAPGPQE